jgi:hypothetical protein
MIENEFDNVVTEKKRIPKWVIILFGGVVFLGVSIGSYIYYIFHKQYPTPEVTSFVLSDELKAKVDILVKADESQKKQLEQLKAITMPEPGNTDDVDAAAYFAATSSLSLAVRMGVSTDTVDSVFTIGGVSFGDFLTQQSERDKYVTLFTNLHDVISSLQHTFKRPALYQRIDGVELVGSTSDQFVYPSERVADGYLTAAIATAIDSTSEASNQLIADDFARRGMLYGWYGQSDVDATKSFMDEYLSKIPLREYLTVTTDTQDAH